MILPIRDHNPSGCKPYVTYALIALNVLIHIYVTVTTYGNDYALYDIYDNWALIPQQVHYGHDLHGLFSSMFLHADWLHLLGNMWFLYLFGDNVEDEMGHGWFLLYYLASGILAAIAQYAFEPYSAIPVVGASGAISAVMGGYFLLYPLAKVDFFIFYKIFPIPAFVCLGLWFIVDLFEGVSTNPAESEVAYWEHVGGFVAGFILTLPLWRRRGGRDFWKKTDFHPPHPEANYDLAGTRKPKISMRRK